jgi:hypothetical protein
MIDEKSIFKYLKAPKIDRRTKAWKSWKSIFDRLDKSLDEEKILREKDHEK